MRRPSVCPAFACVLTVVLCSAAPPAAAEERSRFGVSAGVFDTARNRSVSGESSAEVGFEYRFRPQIVGLIPVVGGMVNSDQGGLFYAGLRYEWRFTRRLILAPFAGAAAYEAGDGKDLGQTLEFRTGLELAYQVGGRRSVGLAFYHVSNADLAEENPGANSLVLTYNF